MSIGVRMNKIVPINLEEIVRVCNILDSLRVSLDRIGAIDKQGPGKMMKAMDEYFTPEVYREIADNWLLLAKIIEKEIGHDEFLKQSKSKKIKYFELKKY